MRQIFKLLEGKSLVLIVCYINFDLKHLIDRSKDIKRVPLLIINIIIFFFKGKLFMIISTLYNCYHFLDFEVSHINHAKTRSICLKAKDEILTFKLLYNFKKLVI